ncbi:MAG: hypothetical protein ACHWZW_09840 [Spirulina sp.]
MLNLEDAKQVDSRDVNYWFDNPKRLPFPKEIAEVGAGILGQCQMPLVKKDSRLEATAGSLQPDEQDIFLSSTARLTAQAPFQVVSDGKYVCVFRQSIGESHADQVFLGGVDTATGDAAKAAQIIGRVQPLVNGTLLVDRFLLVGIDLKNTQEVRFQRSRNKTTPQSNKDSLGAKDLEGNTFYEPTQHLSFIRNLQDGRFAVLLLPTQIAELMRWQIFAYNSKTERIDSINIEQAKDGLFNTVAPSPIPALITPPCLKPRQAPVQKAPAAAAPAARP